MKAATDSYIAQGLPTRQCSANVAPKQALAWFATGEGRRFRPVSVRKVASSVEVIQVAVTAARAHLDVRMQEAFTSAFQNNILRSLKAADIELFLGVASRVSLPVGRVLERPYEEIEEVYFPEMGVLSIDAMTRAGFSMQIAMIGSEGASGTTLVLGNKGWAQTTVVHVESVSWSILASDFQMLLSKSPGMRNAMLRYTSIVAGQMASAALANGRSTIPERLARWIVQMHSRTGGTSFEATQETIAGILGVRRPGITTALQLLERDNLVQSTRGRITIIDRTGLIAASGGSFRDGD